MKNDKTQFLQKYLKADTRLAEHAVKAGRMLLAAALAALLCGPVIGEDKRPLCLAFLIACPAPYCAAAMAGCLAAYWLGGIGADFAAYLAACGVVSALRWMLTGFRESADAKTQFWPGYVAAACSLSLTRLAVAALLQRLDADAVFSLLLELAVLLALSLCMHRSRLSAKQLRSGILPALPDILCCSAVLGCVCASLCIYSAGLLSAGHIFTAFGAAVCGYIFPQPAGSAFAAALCAGCMLAEPQFAFGAAGIAAAGCAAQLGKAKGKAVYTLLFLLPAAGICFAAPSELYGAVYLTELFCAALIFLLLPLPQFRPASEAFSTDRFSQATAAVDAKLQSAYESLSDIGTLLERTLPNPIEPNRGELLACCVERVCRSCRNMSTCWLQHYDRTHSAFLSLADQLAADGTLTREQLQRTLHGECIAANRLCSELCDSHARSVSAAREQRSAVICREVLKEQFDAVAQMLQSIRLDMQRLGSWDEEKSRRISECTARLGLEPVTVHCCSAERLCVSICLKRQPTAKQCEQLGEAISPVMGHSMQAAQTKKTPRGWTVTLQPQPRFTLQTAALQHSANRSVCGDVYSVFENEADGSCHLLLCDGMGTGSAAAQDGALCCSLLCRLLRNGFDVYAAARLVNAVFSLRQDTEAACTLDLFSFFTASGEAQLMKAGAAASYLLQSGTVTRFDGRTLPVGILDKVFCSRKTLQLQQGDMILLLSDGFDDYAELIAELLQRHGDDSPDALCRELMRQAKDRGLRDDATVLAAKVCART